ncbi:hypothetical protein K2173_019732 [Erythroxylum novogranatense]|uniref:BHLH domain-containing protein n=1 Tax=Erythroxylum novogranatense TaxID=1862640 RepID=A0AAV8SN25_9ROSI|nr:hypothetical protein K2173_019732 [Erythroxylum novogranatense]
MGSEITAGMVGEANVTVETVKRCDDKNKVKVPKRKKKADREKLKREQLNELFVELANVLELAQSNSGKAFILNEATRILKDLVGQIDCLKKENMSLLSESNYVTIEKNELKDENSALESQVGELQCELEARLAQPKHDFNEPPEFQQPEFTPHLPVEPLRSPAADAIMQQAPAVFVVPFRPDIQQGYPVSSSHVSKPHARYPTAADSWPSQLLGEQFTNSKAVQFSGHNDSICNTRE